MLGRLRAGAISPLQMSGARNALAWSGLAAPIAAVTQSRRGTLWIALGVVALIAAYVYTDFTFPLTPGNRASTPLGWWAWDDQRQYLIGAKALLRGDFNSDQHLYPPLYPLIGALFLKAAPTAPYFWPDLALMLAYFGFFVAVFRHYIGIAPAVVCALAGMLLYSDIRAQWLMPWTTTPAAVLILAALLLLDRAWRRGNDGDWTARIGAANAAGFGLALGLLAADRPVDVAVTAPLWLAYACLVLSAAQTRGHRYVFATAGAGLAGVAAAAIPYLLFNLASYGTPLGRYLAHNAKMEFDPSVLPMAFYSHLLSSAPLFAEPHDDWSSRIPLVLLGVLFLPASVAWGPLTLRLIAACGLIEFFVYYCDHDIIPTGTFRFCNIHYFKWLAPVAFALGYYAVKAAAAETAALRRGGRFAIGSVAAATLFGACIAATAYPTPALIVGENDRELTITLSGEPFDYVDVEGVTGQWGAIYFPSGAIVRIDNGAPLAAVREWRFLPRPDGLRIQFPGRQAARKLSLRLADGMRRAPDAELRAVAARLSLTFKPPAFGSSFAQY